ncbi:MAG: NRDE family protein [Ferruginibacter sp.]
MCTVTFIATPDQYYLSSNRDEHYSRGKALVPATQLTENGNILLYPKDPDAGGTWLLARNNGDAAVLLNGAFDAHEKKGPYRKSRGLVLLDIAGEADMHGAFKHIDLYDIEPFTVILFTARQLFECRWDGAEKHTKAMNIHESYIWSSATLYNEQARIKREGWFNAWKENYPAPTREDILYFHRHTGNTDRHNGLVMNRSNQVRTVSISCISLNSSGAELFYTDLADQHSFNSFLANKFSHADEKK